MILFEILVVVNNNINFKLIPSRLRDKDCCFAVAVAFFLFTFLFLCSVILNRYGVESISGDVIRNNFNNGNEYGFKKEDKMSH